MSAIGKIGSVLKRAALYIPRKIAARYRPPQAHQWVPMMKPGLSKIARIDMINAELKRLNLKTNITIADAEHADLSAADFLAKGATHVQDEAIGPFGSTATAKPTWSIEDQKFFFGEKLLSKIEDEAIGPFRSTAVKPTVAVARSVLFRLAKNWTIKGNSQLINSILWPNADQKFFFGEILPDQPKRNRSPRQLFKRARQALKNNWTMGSSTYLVADLINWLRKK